MLNRSIKIFILFYLFAAVPCFSQTKKDAEKSSNILSQYDNYLNAVHLNELVRATSFGYYKRKSQRGPNGIVERRNVYVLSLEAEPSFEDETDFRLTWQETIKMFDAGTGIYQQLFFQLAGITRISQDSLVVSIEVAVPKTGAPKRFKVLGTTVANKKGIYMVYFDTELKVVEPETGLRGGVATTPVKPDDLNNVLYSWFFRPVVYSQKLKDSLRIKINSFLSQNSGKDGKPVKPKIFEVSPGVFFFEVRNAKALVTPGYFEDVTLTLFINLIPAKDSKTPALAAVSYLYSVLYSRNEYTEPATPENSENVVVRYRERLRKYGDNLYKLIDNAVR